MDFNPRLPCGRRRLHREQKMRDLRFQSTPPVWEATSIHVFPVAVSSVISIHASRVGGDGYERGRETRGIETISIHASRVGGDARPDYQSFLKTLFQSTPPVWEATRSLAMDYLLIRHFNPRLPCGRRRLSGSFPASHVRKFQSTPPVWEATTIYGNSTDGSKFQSTPPVWEATPKPRSDGSQVKKFQSTPPVWEATTTEISTLFHCRISIHASRVGGDHCLKY